MDQGNETAEPTQTNTTTPSQTGDNAGRPGQCTETITADTAQSLVEINQNMSKMAALLQKMFERDAALPAVSHHDNEHCETHSDASALSDTDHRDDISVTASDSDIRAFLAHDCIPAEQAGTTQTDSPTSDNPSNAHDIDLLKEIDLNLSEADPAGPKIHDNLANIANKRWGIALSNDKLKTMLSKYPQPANSSNMSVPKVNTEIWDQMLHTRKRSDLRLSNMQSVLQKASFSLLKTCDHMVSQNADTNKTLIANTIDAIALIGHTVGELSNLRREQVRPALRPEFHSLCKKTDDSSHSPWLFGEDLAKRVRDTKETFTLSRSLGNNKTRGGNSRVYRPSYRAERSPYDRTNRGNGNNNRYETGNRQFFGKGQKKPPFKNKQHRS